MPMMVSSTPSLPACCTSLVEQGNQAIAALEGKTLLAYVLGVQVALQAFRRGQLPQDVLLLIDAEATLHARHLKAVLQPQPLLGIRYVGKFGADGVRINEFQIREDVSQRGALGNGVIAAAGKKFGIQIGIGKTEVL